MLFVCLLCTVCSSGDYQLATSKGLVAGDLQFTDADGNIVDCASRSAVPYLVMSVMCIVIY